MLFFSCEIIFLLFFYSSTVVSIFPLPFSPTPITPTSHPQASLPVALSMGLLYLFLDDLSHSFSHYPPPLSPLVTVHFFFISVSGYILLNVCFLDWVPLISEIIWYLSFAVWFISLSIMLSSSIHAVTKGRSSFFLSAAWYSIL